MLHDNIIKLGDFGFCDIVKPGKKLKEQLGSPLYMGPEVFNGSYDGRTDIYSLGCFIFEMLFGT